MMQFKKGDYVTFRDQVGSFGTVKRPEEIYGLVIRVDPDYLYMKILNEECLRVDREWRFKVLEYDCIVKIGNATEYKKHRYGV